MKRHTFFRLGGKTGHHLNYHGRGGLWKFEILIITCLYGTVLEINYLFHAEVVRNYLFKKYSTAPPLVYALAETCSSNTMRWLMLFQHWSTLDKTGLTLQQRRFKASYFPRL